MIETTARARFFIESQPENLPGGQYVAIQEDDGTWTITTDDRVGLPIFAELEAGARENAQSIGREWMVQAIANHRALEQDQKHLAPVHASHHSAGHTPDRIGFLRLTKTGKIQQNGEQVDALFAEICGVKDEDLKRLENLELPYRSVEIGRWDRPEISSLALLEDEAPYFKMPMLKVAKKVPRFDRPSPAPVVAMAQDQNGSPLILFSFKGAQRCVAQEDSMPKQGTTPKTIVSKGKRKPFSVMPGPGAQNDKEDQIKTANPQLDDDDTGDTGAAADVSSDLQDDDTGDSGDSGESGDSDSDGGDDSDQMQEDSVDEAFARAFKDYMSKKMRKLMAGAAASFQQHTPAGNEDRGTAPVEPAGAKASQGAAHHLSEAGYEARIAGLEAKLRRQDSEKTQVRLVEKAVAGLKAEGWEVDPKSEATMKRLVEKSSAPAETIKIFCDNFKAVAPKDPVKFSEFLSRPEGDIEAADPPEVMKFTQKGPEALAMARDYSSRFDELKANGFPLSVTREQFISENIEADALNAARASEKKSAS